MRDAGKVQLGALPDPAGMPAGGEIGAVGFFDIPLLTIGFLSKLCCILATQ